MLLFLSQYAKGEDHNPTLQPSYLCLEQTTPWAAPDLHIYRKNNASKADTSAGLHSFKVKTPRKSLGECSIIDSGQLQKLTRSDHLSDMQFAKSQPWKKSRPTFRPSFDLLLTYFCPTSYTSLVRSQPVKETLSPVMGSSLTSVMIVDTLVQT